MSKIAVKMSEATNAIVNLGRTLDNEKKKKKKKKFNVARVVLGSPLQIGKEFILILVLSLF